MAGKNHNTLIGFLLIGAIMVGFLMLQARSMKQQAELQRAQQLEELRRDSIDLAQRLEQQRLDSLNRTAEENLPQEEFLAAPQASAEGGAEVSVSEPGGEDAQAAAEEIAAATVPVDTLTISNDLLELKFLSRGATPFSALVKTYSNYGGTPLYLYKTEATDSTDTRDYSQMGCLLEFAHDGAGFYSSELDFQRDSTLSSESTLVLSAEFGGGRIIQTYSLTEGSYLVDYKVAFKDFDATLPGRVSSIKLNYNLAIPRMEKGFRNEKQYSKLNYAFAGEDDIEDIGGSKDENKTESAPVSWVGYQQQFFSVILRCKDNFAGGKNAFVVKYGSGKDNDPRLMTCMATLSLGYDGGSKDFEIPFEIYMGPNSYYGLKAFDQHYEKIVPLGGWLIGWFTKWVIIPLFDFFHDTLGILNFGLIILLMTLVIKLIVLPLAYKSYSSSAKMAALRPEIEKINEKFPKQEDAMKKQQATMNLYKRAGVSPMGGCLPMILQFPILWAMFRFFPASIELRQQGFLWADDLSTYDNILPAGFDLPFLGHLSLFALLMAASMFFYSKLTSSTQMTGNDPSAKMMKFMSVWMMPIMMFFICNSLSSGLSYYYLLSNLITMLETWIIRKWFVHPDEILAKVHATEGKPMPKSKWQLRLEEAQKMQRQREQQKKNGRR